MSNFEKSPLFEIHDLYFAYDAKPVLQGLSFSLERSSITGLLGSNGAGKSTTFQLIMGLLRPASGTITLKGQPLQSDLRAARRLMGYLPEQAAIFPYLNALENLNLFGLLWGIPASQCKEKSCDLIQRAGLWESRHLLVNGFSKGMVQKLALCAVLLHEPELLVLDEPFSGLDFGAYLWARKLLQTFADQGGTVLISSHQPEVFESLTQRVLLMRAGVIHKVLTQEEIAAQGGVLQVVREGFGDAP